MAGLAPTMAFIFSAIIWAPKQAHVFSHYSKKTVKNRSNFTLTCGDLFLQMDSICVKI